ncbi:hypothetical protein H2509_07655 [Stappia sp. F7233]|uniref:DUF4439 domain-containing protein n=1 Tax=Stappia albiluteola TaxID=2758565 RepID=A0A839ADG8_9HYPH|nr:hypothetical protein [Stappia albiluteola]MBA5777004.1 hypothetical protein [Stappia albiluteola]
MRAPCLQPFLAALVFVGTATFALAADYTPADAYQRATRLKTMVASLLAEDLLPEKLAADPEPVASKPRHVLRLAVDVFERVQTLRSLNGLPENPAPDLPPEQATPGHVVDVLEAATRDLAELAPVYSVTFDTALPAREDGRGPHDVLARLRAINASLEHLGVPPVLPNDVYRAALGLDAQLAKVAKLRGATTDVDAPTVTSAQPKDALAEAISFIADLERISAERPDLALPQGVATPPVPAAGQPVKPADVLLATQFALADVYSLSVALGNRDPLEPSPPQAGKTPADTQNAIAHARAQLAAIAATR